MGKTNKKYAFEVVSDPATRANFDLIAKTLDKLRKDYDKVNYITSEATVESSPGIGFLVTSLYPTFTDVVPLNLRITTTGKPIWLSLAPRKGDNVFQGNISVADTPLSNSTVAYIRFYRDGIIIYETEFGYNNAGVLVAGNNAVAPNMFWHRDDDVTSGPHEYKVAGAVNVAGLSMAFNWVRLWAQELGGGSLNF